MQIGTLEAGAQVSPPSPQTDHCGGTIVSLVSRPALPMTNLNLALSVAAGQARVVHVMHCPFSGTGESCNLVRLLARHRVDVHVPVAVDG